MPNESTTVRLECRHARKHKEEKSHDPLKHRNASSRRINCPFHINLRSPKNIAPRWNITLIADIHNHEMNPDTARFSRELLRLKPEMVEKIQLYAKVDLGLTKVMALLRQEWPDHHFVSQHISLHNLIFFFLYSRFFHSIK
jgi:hypothetical protein